MGESLKGATFQPENQPSSPLSVGQPPSATQITAIPNSSPLRQSRTERTSLTRPTGQPSPTNPTGKVDRLNKHAILGRMQHGPPPGYYDRLSQKESIKPAITGAKQEQEGLETFDKALNGESVPPEDLQGVSKSLLPLTGQMIFDEALSPHIEEGKEKEAVQTPSIPQRSQPKLLKLLGEEVPKEQGTIAKPSEDKPQIHERSRNKLEGLFGSELPKSENLGKATQSNRIDATRTEKTTQKNFHLKLPFVKGLLHKAYYPLAGKGEKEARNNAKSFIREFSNLTNKEMISQMREKFGATYTEENLGIAMKNALTKAKVDPSKEFDSLSNRKKMEVGMNMIKNITDVFYEETSGAKFTPIKVDRGDKNEHEIACRHYAAGEMNAPTMVLFHGNNGVGDSMHDLAVKYKEEGWNVLTVTMGGYPGSDPKLKNTSEETTIQDTHAVIRHLEELGVTTIGIHGYSMGGSLAMHATKMSDKVKVVVADRTFTSAKNVGENLVLNSAPENMRGKIAKFPLRGIIRSAFPKGNVVHGVTDKEGKPYLTDGLDNASKARDFKGVLISIGASGDQVMSGISDSQELAEKHRQEENRDTSTITLGNADHATPLIPDEISENDIQAKKNKDTLESDLFQKLNEIRKASTEA